MKKITVFLFALISFSCTNTYKQYGDKIKFSTNEINNFAYHGETKQISIKFGNSSFNIKNRIVLFRLNSYTIYYCPFEVNKPLHVNIPPICIDNNVSPCIIIVEPNNKEAYYFESKKVLELKNSDSILNISLIDAKEYSD
jgi:hypothetical protein